MCTGVENIAYTIIACADVLVKIEPKDVYNSYSGTIMQVGCYISVCVRLYTNVLALM